MNLFFRAVCALSLLLCISACAATPDSRRAAVPYIVWPPPPETPRIRFVGSITGPLDLGIRKSVMGRFFDYMVGRKTASIIAPYGVAADAAGRLYVVDTQLRKIHVFDMPANDYYLFPDQSNRIYLPIDLAVDSKSGLIYVTDARDKVVKVFSHLGRKPAGEIGRGDLERPTGIAINRKTSELLVVDTTGSNVVRYALDDYRLKGLFGAHGAEDGKLHYPTNIFTTPEGKIVVSDSLNFRVQIFSPLGIFENNFGRRGNMPGSFSRPRGVAADSDGNIYVVDALFDIVQIFDAHGRLLMDFGGPGHEAGRFWLPTGIFIDENDMIYVSDGYNNRVQVFQYLKAGGAPE